MGFRKKLFSRVASDSGFIVTIRAFKGYVEYREGDRVSKIPVQPVFGRGVVSVYLDTPVKWNVPHNFEEISEEKRIQIIRNIVDAMRFRKYTVEEVQKTLGGHY